MATIEPEGHRPARWVSGGLIGLITVGWIGGTGVLLLSAFAQTVTLGGPPVSADRQLLADHLVEAGMVCAVALPLVAAVLCGVSGRRVGAVVFLVFGVLPGFVVGLVAGHGVTHDVHRLSPVAPVQLPSNYCACRSGSSCDCPGG